MPERREGSKQVRLSVGKNAQDAVARRLRKEAKLNVINNGMTVVPEKGNGQRSLAETAACRTRTASIVSGVPSRAPKLQGDAE